MNPWFKKVDDLVMINRFNKNKFKSSFSGRERLYYTLVHELHLSVDAALPVIGKAKKQKVIESQIEKYLRANPDVLYKLRNSKKNQEISSVVEKMFVKIKRQELPDRATKPSIPKQTVKRPLKINSIKSKIKKEGSESEQNLKEYATKVGLTTVIFPLTFKSIDDITKEAKLRYCLDAKLLLMLYSCASTATIKKYLVNTIFESYVKEIILKKRNGKETPDERNLLNIYNNRDGEPVFDIMSKKRFTLNWNDVIFSFGYFTIYPPRTSNIKFIPTQIRSQLSDPSLNYIRSYIQQKIPDVSCIAYQNTLIIESDVQLDKAIRVLKTVARQSVLKTKPQASAIIKSPNNSIQFSVKNFKEAKRLAERLTPEELKKYKSAFINYLSSKQLGGYLVIPCCERYCHINDDITEHAFIFTMASNNRDRVILAVENLNTDRATLLFAVRQQNYETALNEIHSYLQSGEVNKRSKLRDYQIKHKTIGFIDFAHVDHRTSQMYNWYDMLKYYLRNL